MSRLHTDPVEVRRDDDEPAQFLWCGRLYVVREVLARWTESGGWWRAPAVSSLSSGDAIAGPAHAGPAHVGPAHAGPAPEVGAAVGPVGVDDGERDWWRVEAAAGRAAGTGVYDLCFDCSRGTWSLARVLD